MPYLIRNTGIEQIVKHSIYSQVPLRQIYAARTAYSCKFYIYKKDQREKNRNLGAIVDQGEGHPRIKNRKKNFYNFLNVTYRISGEGMVVDFREWRRDFYKYEFDYIFSLLLRKNLKKY